MRIKNMILILVTTFLLVILLQGSVNAGNVAEFISSEYDYFLTESNKVLSKTELSDTANAEEEIIVCIEGEYTGTIEKLSTGEIKISNFNADAIEFLTNDYYFWIDGVNEINKIDGGWIDVFPESNGKLTYDIIGSNLYHLSSDYCYLSGQNYLTYTDSSRVIEKFFGPYIYETGEVPLITVNFRDISITDEHWKKIEELIKPNTDINFEKLTRGTIVPESIFKKLYEQDSAGLTFVDNDYDIIFWSHLGGYDNATNFIVGVEISEIPEWNMVDTKTEDVLYINFEHSGKLPGPIWIGGAWCLPSEVPLECYYFNEDTRLYERVKDAEISEDGILYMNIDHCSKYVLTENELPADLVANDDANYGSGEGEPEDKEPEAPKNEEEDKKEENKKEDTTTASGNVPYAGGTTVVIISVLALIIVAVVLHIKNKELRGI